MDMRDKIAAEHDRIIHATIDEPCSYKRSVFRAGWDAHKAALPDMIAPLVWRGDFAHNGMGTMYHLDQRYDGTVIEIIEGATTTRSFYEWTEPAKAAANAHNRAAIMAAFNQLKEPK